MQECDSNTCNVLLDISGDPLTNIIRCNATDAVSGAIVFELMCNQQDISMYKSYTACTADANGDSHLSATYVLDKTLHPSIAVSCRDKNGLEFTSTADTSFGVDIASGVSGSSYSGGQLTIILDGSFDPLQHSLAYAILTETQQDGQVVVTGVPSTSITFNTITGELVVAGLNLDDKTDVQVEFALQNSGQYQQVNYYIAFTIFDRNTN